MLFFTIEKFRDKKKHCFFYNFKFSQQIFRLIFSFFSSFSFHCSECGCVWMCCFFLLLLLPKIPLLRMWTCLNVLVFQISEFLSLTVTSNINKIEWQAISIRLNLLNCCPSVIASSGKHSHQMMRFRCTIFSHSWWWFVISWFMK